MTDNWQYHHGPHVRRRCCHCIGLSVVSSYLLLLTHVLADKANAVGLLVAYYHLPLGLTKRRL